jgi:membrane-associated phospholipid phosphatase
MRLRHTITKSNILLLLVTAAVLCGYLLLNRAIGHIHNLHTGLDSRIPFEPPFAVPYILFLPVFFIVALAAFLSNRRFKSLALTIIVVYGVSYLFFYFFQTMVIRPAVTGNDIFAGLVRHIYSSDRPYNDFPSTHSSSATIMAMYFFLTPTRWLWRLLAAVFAVVVVLSTLFVKQHYIADAAGGVTLGAITTMAIFRWRTD